MIDDHTHILLCGRVGHPEELGKVVAGSLQQPCAQCGQILWASPASLMDVVAKGPNHALLCYGCGSMYIGDSLRRGKMKLAPPSAGQRRELLAEGVSSEWLEDLLRRLS